MGVESCDVPILFHECIAQYCTLHQMSKHLARSHVMMDGTKYHPPLHIIALDAPIDITSDLVSFLSFTKQLFFTSLLYINYSFSQA